MSHLFAQTSPLENCACEICMRTMQHSRKPWFSTLQNRLLYEYRIYLTIPCFAFTNNRVMYITQRNLSVYHWLFPSESFLEAGSKVMKSFKDCDIQGQMLSGMIIFTDMQPMVTLLLTPSHQHFKIPSGETGMRLSSPSIHRGMLLEPWMPTLPLTKTISGLQMICSCSPLSQDHGSSGITFFLVLLPTWALPFHSHTAQFCLYEPILPSLLTPRATNSPGFFYSAPNWKNAIYVASMVLDRKMVSETSFWFPYFKFPPHVTAEVKLPQ